MTKKINETKVLLTNVRLSYPHLFEAYSFNGQEPKYSASLLVSKDDKESIAIITKAFEEAFKAGVEKGKLSAKDKSKIRLPLRDGDADRPDDEVYANCYFINTNSKRAPQVVGRYKDPETGKPVELDEESCYAGCFVNATITFYAYSVSGNKGIAAGLGNIQKYADGERLGGAASASSDFDFEEAPEADLEEDWMN